MQPIINEWQLKSELNRALQQQCHADFALWMSFLSPAVEEMAAFTMQDAATPKPIVDYYQQFGVQKSRDPAMTATDLSALTCQHTALVEQGFSQWRLLTLLQPPASVILHDAKKLAADVLDNVSSHCKRRMAGQAAAAQPLDATLLYDMLNDLDAVTV